MHHHKLRVVLNILTPRKRYKWNGKQIETNKSRRRGVENMFKNKPGPRSAATSVKISSSSFKLFFLDKMMENIVQYTSKNMQPVIDKFSNLLDSSTKNSHVKLVDRADIEAFIGFLFMYLRAAFRLNNLDREVVWNHESAHDIIGATYRCIDSSLFVA